MSDDAEPTIPAEERELLSEWITAQNFGRPLGLSITEARAKLIEYRDAGLIVIYDNGFTALKFRLTEVRS